MYPLARLAKVMTQATTGRRLGPLDEGVVRFRVWPGDLDTNRHLNNGRYLTLMDLGRFDLVARTGLMGPMLRHKWYPVVGAVTMRFRRSLDPFQRYELRTRILGWDDRAIWLGQSFVRGGAVHASGAVRGVFLGPEGRVPTQRIVDLIAPGLVAPPLPEWVRAYQQALDAQSKE